jgi:hypothetical protein
VGTGGEPSTQYDFIRKTSGHSAKQLCASPHSAPPKSQRENGAISENMVRPPNYRQEFEAFF